MVAEFLDRADPLVRASEVLEHWDGSEDGHECGIGAVDYAVEARFVPGAGTRGSGEHAWSAYVIESASQDRLGVAIVFLDCLCRKWICEHGVWVPLLADGAEMVVMIEGEVVVDAELRAEIHSSLVEPQWKCAVIDLRTCKLERGLRCEREISRYLYQKLGWETE